MKVKEVLKKTIIFRTFLYPICPFVDEFDLDKRKTPHIQSARSLNNPARCHNPRLPTTYNVSFARVAATFSRLGVFPAQSRAPFCSGSGAPRIKITTSASRPCTVCTVPMRVGALTISVTSEGEEHEFSDDKQFIVFRIIQECLNNCLKHARATGGSGDIRSRPRKAPPSRSRSLTNKVFTKLPGPWFSLILNSL
jgi:hypothetical protein